MPQVSKYPMDRELEKRMFDIFYQTIADLKSKGQVQDFLSDLLSQTEHVMLSKRLAIAVLLIKGNTYEMIRDTLKVSTSTIVTIKYWLDDEGKGYRKAIEKILKKESIEEFIDRVDEALNNALIPRHGSHWSRIQSERWKKRIKRKKERTI